MLVEDILKATKGSLINGDLNVEIKRYIIDNREDTTEALFVPLVGEKVDAHIFINDCVEKGILAFFINTDYKNKQEVINKSISKNKNVIIIEVEDTLKALYDTAVYNRNLHSNIPVVTVTGSVGKTSTREMIYSVLKQEMNVLVTEKNYNGYLGLSLMALKIDNQDICVLEAGIDRFGEMEELSKILLPDIAVMTMIGTSHIEKLITQENIFKEKLKITNDLRGINTLIINNDDKFLTTIKNNTSYDVQRYESSQAKNIEVSSKGITFDTNIYGKEEKIKLNVIGEHNVLNALAAIKVGELLGIKKQNIIKGIEEYKNYNRRLEIKQIKNNITIIDDTYNASADSMKSGLKTVNKFQGNKIAVLGDMLELGSYSESLHAEVGKIFKELSYSKVLTCGNYAKYISDEAKKYVEESIHFSDIEELKYYIIQKIKNDDILYFKASNGMKFSKLVEDIIEKY